jgi:AraC-like DNA-binding protein
MGSLETFSTRLVAPERRQSFWCELVAETFPGMSIDVPVGICADLARWRLGRIAMARALSARARIERQGSDKERHIVLHYQRRGQLVIRQGRAVTMAGAGDIVIVGDDRPYSIEISDRNDCLVVDMSADMLDDDVSGREWHAHLLPGSDPQVTLLRGMIEGLWCERNQLSQMSDQTDQVVASLAHMAMRRHTPANATDERGGRAVFAYVARHLSDPDLGTARIAGALGLSPRAVQKAFARRAGATPTGFITDMRLQRAAEMLTCSGSTTVTEIAFEVGFSDSAFFSRCFRRRFGVSPTQWRAGPAG